MSGLVGFFERPVDEKSRLVLPAEIRKRLGQQVIISRWYDHGLALFDEETYARLAEAISQQGSHNAKKRQARRGFFGGASLVSIDGQGRMTLPEWLKEDFLLDPTSSTDRQVVILGDWDKVLLYSGLRYKDLLKGDSASLDETLADAEEEFYRIQPTVSESTSPIIAGPIAGEE